MRLTEKSDWESGRQAAQTKGSDKRESWNNATSNSPQKLADEALMKRFQQGDRIMLLSFASGLVIGIVIFPMNGMVKRYGN